jgi:hypothetical protein
VIFFSRILQVVVVGFFITAIPSVSAANACPTDVVASRWSVQPANIDAAAITIEIANAEGKKVPAIFISNKWAGTGLAPGAAKSSAAGAQVVDGPIFGSGSAVLSNLYGIIEDTAKAEMQRFAVQFIEDDLCVANSSALYFPNTCAMTAALSVPSVTSLDHVQAILKPLESDIRSLPSCVIFQRTSPSATQVNFSGSHFGYLMGDFFSQLNKLPRSEMKPDKKGGQLLYGLTKSTVWANDCSTGPPNDPKLSFACTMLTTMEVLRASLELDASITSGEIAGDPTSMEKNAAALLKRWAVGIAGDCSNASLNCQTVLDVVKKWTDDVVNNAAANQAFLANAALIVRQIQSVSSDWSNVGSAMQSAADNLHPSTMGSSTLPLAVGQFAQDVENAFETGICLSQIDVQTKTAIDCTQQGSNYENWIYVTKGIWTAYADVMQRQYTPALAQVSQLLTCGSSEESAGVKCKSVLGDGPAMHGALRTLGMAAQLAGAKSSADAKSIFEQWATTLGRYDMKGKSDWLPSVGSSFGVQYGHEALASTGVATAGQFYGMYVPIGFQWSFTSWLGEKRYWGFGANALNLGNLASTSTSSNTNSGAHNSVGSVVAPELFVYQSLWGPVVAGVNYAPKTRSLREAVAANGQTQGLDSSHRWSVFFAVDVPLWIFQ